MEGGLWRSNRGSKKIIYLFFLLRKLFPFLFLFIACLLYLLRRDLRTLPSLTTIWEVLTMLRKQGWIVRSSALPHFPTATVAKSLQSCPTLYNPIDGSPPGSPVPGILQARTLDWVAISFSNAWKWTVKVAQSCPTRCNPVDCNLPSSSVHGIFQARGLKWGAIAFSTHFPRTVILTLRLP